MSDGDLVGRSVSIVGGEVITGVGGLSSSIWHATPAQQYMPMPPHSECWPDLQYVSVEH